MFAPGPRDPYLQELWEAAHRATARVEAAVRALGPGRLDARPADGGWSCLDILEHLVLAAELYRPRIEAAIRAAPTRDASGRPFRPGILGAWLIRAVGPGSARKMRAPRIFRPPAGAARDPGTLLRFRETQRALGDLIESADGRDLGRPKLSSPASALIRLRVGEALAVLVRHEERHVAQIERLVGAAR